MSNIENLKARAQGVQAETAQGQNTADRVGGLLVDIISELGTTQTTVNNLYNEIINHGGSYAVDWSYTEAPMSNPSPIGYLTINGSTKTLKAPAGSGSSPISGSAGYVSDVVLASAKSSGTAVGRLTVKTMVPSGSTYSESTKYFDLYLDSSSIPGGGSSGGGVTPADVQEQIDTLNNAIATAEEQAEKEKNRLDALLKKLDSQITDEVLRMDNQAAWIQQNFDADKVFGYSGWDDAMQGYMERVGLWTTDEDTTKTFWSDVLHTYDSIKSNVNTVINGPGGLNEYLSSHIDQWIQDGTVTIDLGAMYAAKEAESIIEWLYSGLKSSTSPDRTFNEIVSAGKNGLNSAIADIHTYVEKLKDGTYIAGLDLSTKVNEAIASIWQKVQSGEVTTGALAELNGNISTLVNTVTGDSSSATIATKVNNWKAGLVTRSNLGEALVSLLALDEDNPNVMAAITAKVQEGLSSIKFEADTIESVSQQYTIHMDKLLLGNSNFYMHTLKDGQSNNIGFEMVCAENVLQNYTEDPNGAYNKITMHYDYTAMTKLSCDHIIMSNGNQGSGGGTSDFQVEKGMTFRWFDEIGTAAGDVYSFNNELGSIVFDGEGIKITMLQGKKIILNGTVLHEV